MPRQKHREIWATHLPKIRAEQLRAFRDSIDGGLYDFDHRAQVHALRHGDLWWVTQPMAILAAHAALDLPDTVQLEDTRPSTGGVIIWDGGTGLIAPFEDAPEHMWSGRAFGHPRAPDVELVGALWTPGIAGPLIYGLTTDPRILALDPGMRTMLVYPPPPVRQRLAALLMSTWLLADQPHIGVRRRATREDTHGRRIPHESEIQVISLRETLPHQESWAEPTEGQKWALTHRTVVSGHWKQQPCGPDRAGRRPIFVQPYVRGPSGAPLIVRPKVKVWRR